ncbi:MAG: hypothetical protein WC404_03340 [Candidatus Omnitrophota bacterium]|jgi:peptidoglycan biosynthesis protein MviN/MurJ (putative lipid II flippase)
MTTEEKWHIAIGIFFVCLFLLTAIGYLLRTINEVAFYVAPVLLAIGIILIMSFVVKKYNYAKLKFAAITFIAMIVVALLCVVIYTIRQIGVEAYFLSINDKAGIAVQAVILALISFVVLFKRNKEAERHVRIDKGTMIKGLFLFILISIIAALFIVGLAFALNKYLNAKISPAAAGGVTDMLIVGLVVIAIAASRKK